MSTSPVQIHMMSDPRFLCGAREFVSAVASRLGFADEDCARIALAVDEALCNILRHGYHGRTDGPIWVRLEPMDEEAHPALRIVIEDEAEQVDPSQIRSRDLDDIRPGGLGVHIIQEIMDEATYEQRENKGMRLTLLKRPRPTHQQESTT